MANPDNDYAISACSKQSPISLGNNERNTSPEIEMLAVWSTDKTQVSTKHNIPKAGAAGTASLSLGKSAHWE